MSADTNSPAASATPTAPAPLTEAEVNQRIENARKEEKQKLYSELESLKAKVANLDASEQKIAALTAQVNEAQQQLAAVSKAKTATGEIDTIALARTVAENTRQVVSAETQRALSDLQAKMAELEKVNQQQRLSAFRSKLITEAKGQIIEAMVVGTTEEELRAAANAARQQYADIVASVNQSTTTAQAASTVTPPPVVQPRTINGGVTPPASGLDGLVRTGDPKAYGKNRQQVLAEVKARFG